ncbi:MAG: hypothetical protein IPL84_00425 [Chitinophagaceae bacterium]|nr:hypothetical protein [Chitinophagaceae bacterium]
MPGLYNHHQHHDNSSTEYHYLLCRQSILLKCRNSQCNQIWYPGGTYSSTAGLSITPTGAVNLGGSTPGTYIVTYTVPASGGCGITLTTTTITITAAPTATIAYTGQSILLQCRNSECNAYGNTPAAEPTVQQRA